jgi:hypothetical protein
VHETAGDLAELQALLDRSFATAGRHLRDIWREDRRLTAAQLVAELPGVQILDLATVNAQGAPRVAPVDGLFFRGHLWFGSAPDSVRVRHLRARPACSAAHTRGESFAVVAHGHAVEAELGTPAREAFVEYLREVYPNWDAWGFHEAPYFRLAATRLYATRLQPTD